MELILPNNWYDVFLIMFVIGAICFGGYIVLDLIKEHHK